MPSSTHLMDPELARALEGVPSFDYNAETIGALRPAVAALALDAPPAPGIATEERFVDGPDENQIRILVSAPVDGPRTGGMLWLHGGGQIVGSSDGYAAQNRYFALRAGIVVVAVDYRLAPEDPYPAGLEDCYAVLRWLHESVTELGISADRIAVAGESGGGGLAAGLAVLARDRGELPLSAQFLLYPMLDDRTGTPADPDPLPYSGEFVLKQPSYDFIWNSVLGREPGGQDVPVTAAPARADDLTGLPPATLLVGDLDLLIGENLRYATTLIRSGVPTDLHVFPGAYHAFMLMAPQAGVSVRANEEFIGAITRHFQPSAITAAD